MVLLETIGNLVILILVIWFTYKKGRPIIRKLLEKYNIK